MCDLDHVCLQIQICRLIGESWEEIVLWNIHGAMVGTDCLSLGTKFRRVPLLNGVEVVSREMASRKKPTVPAWGRECAGGGQWRSLERRYLERFRQADNVRSHRTQITSRESNTIMEPLIGEYER